ncbi:MAG: sensor histidine kinase [Bacilli bacterium]|nr:sensor histidine kinase [Bacilli bacterium]
MNFRSLQLRLFGYLLLTGCIPFLLVSILSVMQNNHQLNRDTQDRLQSSIKLFALQLNDAIYHVDSLYYEIQHSPLADGVHLDEIAQDSSEQLATDPLKQQLVELQKQSPYITGIHLLLTGGNALSSSPSQLPVPNPFLLGSLPTRDSKWVSRDSQIGASETQSSLPPARILSKVGMIFSAEGAEKATLWIDFDVSRFSADALSALDLPGALLAVKTQDSLWNYPVQTVDKDAEWLPAITDNPDLPKTGIIAGHLYQTAQLTNTGWQAFLLCDQQSTTANGWVVFLVLIFLVALFTAVVLSFLMSKRIVRPLNNLSLLMRRAGEGDLKAYSVINGSSEIQALGSSYNQMINQLENLIKQVKSEEQLKKEAEIEALQYQLNPHFLYNTLNTIKWVSKLHKTPKISEIVSSLVRLLQASLGKRGEFIPLAEEIGLVRDYLDIQMFRFGDQIQIHYDISGSAELCLVPHMILQPLVENALFHGLEPASAQGQLWIRARVDEEILVCEVEDNGVGMDHPQTDWHSKQKYSGIGLQHVKERIQLYYGSSYGLRVWSAPGEGTRVILILPVQFEERWMKFDESTDRG